jgi:RNA polymerase-binding transcription factor DksA
LTPAQKAAAIKKQKAVAAEQAKKERDAKAKALAAKALARQKALDSAKAKKERDTKVRALAKEKAAEAKAKATAAVKAKKERDAKAKIAAKEREVARKAREKAAVEAKKQREIDAKRKAIDAEKQRKLREIERRESDERKRQERREAEEQKRLEALERKMHSKPYAEDQEFLEELRVLLVETRDATTAQIAVSESEANEMLVDRERLEYDDEDGSSVASDIQRDQLKDYATALRLKVDEIDVALSRIEDGSYGRCDECYEAISQPRLRAQLPVFTCVSCRASV